jgi:flagellar assembly protein FliH
MHLSNPVKAIHAHKTVFEFVPPKFELGTPQQAEDYLKSKAQGQDFRMSDVIRIQTGVKDIEANSFEEQIELRTLEKLKQIQEAAYQEAYELGLQEGRQEAFTNSTEEINKKLIHFSGLITNIEKYKTELFQYNESHIVQLAFHMAKRLAHSEIKANPEVVKDVIKSALEIAQSEENVTVHISPEQFDFLENLKKETSREFEFLKKVRLEPNPNLSIGGCIIETNYGEIDARFEERINKLWETISENLYRVKDQVGGN